MVVAGIDEAGYGPVLGPLVVGCCAFAIDAPAHLEPPCLWKLLRKIVGKNASRGGRKLHVNDSKIVYTSTGGLKELERATLAFASTMAADGGPGDLQALLERCAPGAAADLAEHPWYLPSEGEPFPLQQPAVSIRMMSNALRQEMQRCGVRCVHLCAQVLPERKLNRLFAATRNKSNVLFSTAALHLDHLLRTYGQQDLTIFCDRQGGREHYGQLLRMMFEDWALEVVQEKDGLAEYGLTRGEHRVRLIFREKAEQQCLAVALASMLCKYLREALMWRFNAFWRLHVPQIEPTAGYYNDGWRFLKEIETHRTALGISDELLIRTR